MNPKKDKTVQIVVGVTIIAIIYLTAIIYFCHFYELHVEYPKKDLVKICYLAFDEFCETPFQIFPIPQTAKTYIIIATIVMALLVWFHYNEQYLKRHDNIETALGDAHWMTPQELKDFYKENTDILPSHFEVFKTWSKVQIKEFITWSKVQIREFITWSKAKIKEFKTKLKIKREARKEAKMKAKLERSEED